MMNAVPQKATAAASNARAAANGFVFDEITAIASAPTPVNNAPATAKPPTVAMFNGLLIA